MNSIGWTRVYYDFKGQKIYHWFIGEDGKHYKEVVPVEYDYYIYSDEESQIKDIYGKNVIPKSSKDYFAFKKFKEVGVKTCEASISQEIKFLQKRYKDTQLKADISKFNIAIIDIETSSEEKHAKPEDATDPINLISVRLSKTNEITTFGLYEYTGNSQEVKNYRWCKDEKTLVEQFILFCRKNRVMIYSGWFCDGYDFPYIINRQKILGIEKTLSPFEEYRKKSDNSGYKTDGGGYEICGINVLDYINLYKNFTRDKKASYTLNNVCLDEIKEGKIQYEGTINTFWKTDWNKFVEYNVQDVMLVKKLDDKLKFFELAVSMCYESLIPFEKVFSAVNLITGIVLKYCHNKNVVIPDRKLEKNHEKFDGAYVMADVAMHHYLMSYDVQSLYPSLIRAFNISPEKIIYEEMENCIKTPIDGIFFKSGKGIVPEIIENEFNKRLRAIDKQNICKCNSNNLSDEEICNKYNIDKNKLQQLKKEIEDEDGNIEYYERIQYIIKIFLNSFFGVYGNPYFILYNRDCAKSITSAGQHVIKYLTGYINNYIKSNWHTIAPKMFSKYVKVDIVNPLEKNILVLVDTDSGHFEFDEMIKKIGLEINNNQDFIDFCYDLNKKLFKPIFEKLLIKYSENFNSNQCIYFQREKISLKKLILAKKKYVDLVIEKKGDIFKKPKISVTGIESVRTDTPKFFRTKIEEVIDCIFDTEDKNKATMLIKEIKDDFYKCKPIDIASPTGIKDYQKYAKPIEYYKTNGLSYIKSTPIHNRSAINYNYIVNKFKLPYQLIDDNTKIKYCYVYDNNLINQNVIGFMGEWPEKFNELFKINYEEQWRVGFEDTINRFYTVMKWGQLIAEECGSWDF